MLRPSPVALLAVALGVPAVVLHVACDYRGADPTPAPPTALHIRDVTNPSLSTHPANSAEVSIRGASYLLTDTFDETQDGRSKGTVYLQDVGSDLPYSGVSLFQPTYSPEDLALVAGDVVQLRGSYVEESSIGKTTFVNGRLLIQIFKPVVQFQYDSLPKGSLSLLSPAVINVTDLNDFTIGRQWGSMLVTVENVTFADNLSGDGLGRFVAHITPDASGNGAEISNELFDLSSWNTAQPTGAKITRGTTFKSLTGIVTWFGVYHIAPRSPDDIVVR
jgi:hypothetical protein